MSNLFFRFKQFEIRQDQCAMKVGTDGVLLGAWAAISSAGKILDIGTGSGLIALMAAQRSEAEIDAIEIEESAFHQAIKNISSSPFSQRIRVYHEDFRIFRQKPQQYDHIISNPPFFYNSLKSPDLSRNYARHTLSLTLEELIEGSRTLLSSTGLISLILPAEQENRLKEVLEKRKLHLNRLTYVYPKPDIPPKRILIEAGMNASHTVTAH